MKTIRSFSEFTWSLIIFFILSLYASAVNGEVGPKDEWVKGSVVVGVSNSGSCIFRPFIKVGDTDNNPDTDVPQILGYEPGNVVIKNNEVIFERVEESVFIPLRQHKTIHGRLCSCPPYNE